jgi:protein tyrosine kinase modulator
MLGHRQLSAAEYLGIWRRRWKSALLSLLLGSGAGYALAGLIPAHYVSTATVAEVQGSSYSAAMPANGMTATQLSALRQHVLTQERMESLAAKYGLNGPASRENSAGAIAKLESNIAVSPAESGFAVSFTAGNPTAAQQVCTELVSLFVQEAWKDQQRMSEQRAGANSSPARDPVADFLASQVADAKRNLDEREANLAEFRRQHAVQLNGSDRIAAGKKIGEDETRLQAADAALKNALQQRTALTESLFAQQSATIESRKTVDAPGTEALEQQLAAEQAQLVILETRYTPDHPDVVKLRSDIDELQKKIEESRKAAGQKAANKADAGPAAEPRRTAQLQAQIHELDALIQEKTHEQGSLQQEILNARTRLNAASILDEEYGELAAETASARTLYTGLLAKQSEAQKAAATEARQREAQLRVVVPPSLPDHPEYPNPIVFTLAGGGSGLAIGLLAIVAGEMRDKSMRTAGDVEFFLELPTLAVIPAAGSGSSGEGGTKGGRIGSRGEKEESVLADV